MEQVVAWLYDPGATFKVLAVFALLVAAVSRKVSLGAAAFCGAVALALWSGAGILQGIAVPLEAALSADALLLSFTLILILGLSDLMKHSGAMEKAARGYAAFAGSPAWALATLPGILGTLPMPGGAGISAPMVAALDGEGKLGAADKAAVNYYFRHTIELVWPLYPAFILTASLSGLSVSALSGINLYVPLVLIPLGYFFLLRKSFPKHAESAARRPGHALGRTQGRREFFIALSPIILAIFIAMILSPLLRGLAGFGGRSEPSALGQAVIRYMPMVLGILAGTVLLLAMSKGSAVPRGIARFFINRGMIKTISMILGIKAFSGTLDTLGLAQDVARELTNLGLGTGMLTVALPFLAGLITGVGFGYVGIAFPIVLALLPRDNALGYAAWVALANASGFMGMMISPLHICAAVSADFFSVPLWSTLKKVALPLACFFLVALGYVSAVLFLAR